MQQTLSAHFYGYIRRDTKTGMSEFRVIPDRQAEGTVNGILRCRGRVRLYAKGMPVSLTGTLEGSVFLVRKDGLPLATRENVFSVLGYLDKSLTDKEKERIAELCGNDLFRFCQDDGNIRLFSDATESGDERKARLIFRKLRHLIRQNDMEELLLRYGIPFDAVNRISRSGATREKLLSDPYRILMKNGISFQTADCFAREEAGQGAYSIARLRGITVAAMDRALAAGNTCLTLKQLSRAACRLSEGMQPEIPDSPALLNACVSGMDRYCGYHLSNGVPCLYINHVWDEECAAVEGIKRLNAQVKEYRQDITAEQTEREAGIVYNKEQRQAFQLLRTSGIKILTGPPGSGKTAILKGMIQNFRANGNGDVVLAATTGMAAKVLGASTGEECVTVHKLLHIVPYQDTVRGKDANDPVEADLVVVDEASMMGLQLFSALVQAVKSGSILLLVGDEDQLQSVEYGNVLHDIEHSGAAQVCRLRQCIRNGGVIFDNARKINDGGDGLCFNSQFRLYELDRRTFASRLTSLYDSATQVICPVNNGPVSVRSVNTLIQDSVNRDGAVAACYGHREFRVGDKVIFRKTDYNKGYINGDIGTVAGCTAEGGMQILLPEGKLHVDQDDYANMDLAYAITIHKSQGSTFPKVVVVLPAEARNMMTRRLLYTAVTRAAESVAILSEQGAFEYAAGNRAEPKRQTLLGQRLKNVLQKAEKQESAYNPGKRNR